MSTSQEVSNRYVYRLMEEMYKYMNEAVLASFCDVRGDFLSPDAEACYEIFIQARQRVLDLAEDGEILKELSNQHDPFEKYIDRHKKEQRPEYTLQEIQVNLPIETQVELLQYQIEILQDQIITNARRITKLENR